MKDSKKNKEKDEIRNKTKKRKNIFNRFVKLLLLSHSVSFVDSKPKLIKNINTSKNSVGARDKVLK